MFKLLFAYSRRGLLHYISHLDMLRLFQRALRRAAIDVAYSKGYNPHMQLSLSIPLTMGVKAKKEYGEVTLGKKMAADNFICTLNPQLPEDLCLVSAKDNFIDKGTLASSITAALYTASIIMVKDDSKFTAELEKNINKLLSLDSLVISKKGKKGVKEVNIRPYILAMNIKTNNFSDLPVISMLLQTGSHGGVSPLVVIDQLALLFGDDNLMHLNWMFEREELYIGQDDNMQPLSKRM